ncbi:hypothetical protein NLG97_g6396 [Lecanicillium saksenae]|uniref:Uncharacterized protein n=1 Tax=Lecanicillium saksenae TaxID=468837 RepID=A0ACC1QRM1_9HYPO|nr:hypothetical protein NLG97_g6396 [Lecanicillium saksenae]
MQAHNSPNNFQITLPAVNQPLTFDDLRSISPAILEESARFAGDASSCHSGMQHTFAYNTTETASHFGGAVSYEQQTTLQQRNSSYTQALSSPTQSLLSHSIDSDFPMESSHGPSTPEEWSTMLTNADKAYHQSWNGGVAPYYDSYAAQDMSCSSSSVQASQIAHLGASFENQPNLHHSDDLLATSSSSAYPAFVSMAPLPYGRDLHHGATSSTVPRGFSHHSDFSSLMAPSADSDARHSSPSSFSTGDDATTNTRASSVSVPRKRRSQPPPLPNSLFCHRHHHSAFHENADRRYHS